VKAILILGCLCLAASVCACHTKPECDADEDCPSPETCVEGDCIDDSCPEGCPGGTFCRSGYCYDCNWDDHCGVNCTDCTSNGIGENCIYYYYPSEGWGCGCYGDWDCLGGLCCNANHCSTCP